MRKRIDYPMGSISSGTMRAEDLIPTFCANLYHCAKVSKANGHFHTIGSVPAKTRKLHIKLVREIESRIEAPSNHAFSVKDYGDGYENNYYDSESASSDLDALFDALGEYAAPYFYFGAHPGNGSDYGFWLSEDWDEDFMTVNPKDPGYDYRGRILEDKIKVSDLSEIPARFRGEVAVISDHGNVTLYVKTSRSLREIWSVV